MALHAPEPSDDQLIPGAILTEKNSAAASGHLELTLAVRAVGFLPAQYIKKSDFSLRTSE
jgi:hypothetical protein